MRILIVDDQAEFRMSLSDLLSGVAGIEVVGQAENGTDAVALALRTRPDVTLMDIRMPVLDGIAATEEICRRWPDARILVLTTFDDDSLIQSAMRAGATGYLLKATPLDDLLAILQLASRGYIAIGRGGVTKPPQKYDDVGERAKRLSVREKEVWALIGRGYTNRDIAERLFLTPGTVKNYVTTILATFQVRHRTEAALLWRHSRGESGIEA